MSYVNNLPGREWLVPAQPQLMKPFSTFSGTLNISSVLRAACSAVALLFAQAGHAQLPDSTAGPVRTINLENIDVAPTAVDTKGWLLLDKDIQTELDGAVHNLYNSKFDRAEKQFRSLRRRYPQHPLPYFLMGLSTWWKIMPSNVTVKLYDKPFFAYMDTAVTKAQALYEKDEKNYEACFFLSAAYGFSSRLHAERSDYAKATVEAKRALKYLERSQEANGLSPEFLFGQALFNYYSVWIGEEHPWLRPVLLLFPKGNKNLGLQQLRNVADNGVYTGPEAKFFLMRILSSERENQEAAALPLLRTLVQQYPDNAYFQRQYALQTFNQGYFQDCERASRDILDKLNRGLPGFDGFSGRYATYYLGYLQLTKAKNVQAAKDYFQRCIVFSEATEQTSGGYYLYANLQLARLASDAKDVAAAKRYYKAVVDNASHKSDIYREAKMYLKSAKRDKTSYADDRGSFRLLVRS
ncbi:hypothetical protein GCM10028821_46860 [Hymenobacter jeollabukensis]